jgi:hypothetical protein
MSDYPPLTHDQLEALKARDRRVQVLGIAIEIENDLQHNATIKAILAAFRADADLAMVELAEVSPTDHAAVSKLLVRVRAAVYIRSTLDLILKRGQVAEAALRDDSRPMEGEEE